MEAAAASSASTHRLPPNACQAAPSTPNFQDVIFSIKYSFKHDPVLQAAIPVAHWQVSPVLGNTFAMYCPQYAQLHQYWENFLSSAWKSGRFVQASEATVLQDPFCNNGFALVITELYLTRAVNSWGLWEKPFLNKDGFLTPEWSEVWAYFNGKASTSFLPHLASKEVIQLYHVNEKPVLAANVLMLHLTWSALKNLI